MQTWDIFCETGKRLCENMQIDRSIVTNKSFWQMDRQSVLCVNILNECFRRCLFNMWRSNIGETCSLSLESQSNRNKSLDSSPPLAPLWLLVCLKECRSRPSGHKPTLPQPLRLLYHWIWVASWQIEVCIPVKLCLKPTGELRMHTNWVCGLREAPCILRPRRHALMTSLPSLRWPPFGEAGAPSSDETGEAHFISLDFWQPNALGSLPGCDSEKFIVCSILGEHIALSSWLGCDSAFFSMYTPETVGVWKHRVSAWWHWWIFSSCFRTWEHTERALTELGNPPSLCRRREVKVARFFFLRSSGWGGVCGS